MRNGRNDLKVGGQLVQFYQLVFLARYHFSALESFSQRIKLSGHPHKQEKVTKVSEGHLLPGPARELDTGPVLYGLNNSSEQLLSGHQVLNRSTAVDDQALPRRQRRAGCQIHDRISDVVRIGRTLQWV